MIILYGVFPSRSNRVQWALEELELDYEFRELDFQKGEHRSPRFLELNPLGKIPVLDDNGHIICESGAICNYLGEKYASGNLIPSPGTPERSQYDRWLFFALTELEQPLWTKAKHTFILPKEHRVTGLGPALKWEFDRSMAVFAEALGEQPFLLGQRFTMVDIVFSQILGWARVAKFDINQQNVIDYQNRMTNRPAYSRMAAKARRPF